MRVRVNMCEDAHVEPDPLARKFLKTNKQTNRRPNWPDLKEASLECLVHFALLASPALVNQGAMRFFLTLCLRHCQARSASKVLVCVCGSSKAHTNPNAACHFGKVHCQREQEAAEQEGRKYGCVARRGERQRQRSICHSNGERVSGWVSVAKRG